MSGEIAFTIALATTITLVYIFYNVFFKKSAHVYTEESDDQKQETISNGKNDTKQIRAKEKKQNLKPIKTKEAVLKHQWLCATLKGKKNILINYIKKIINQNETFIAHSDTVTGCDFSSNGKYLISTGLGKIHFDY